MKKSIIKIALLQLLFLLAVSCNNGVEISDEIELSPSLVASNYFSKIDQFDNLVYSRSAEKLVVPSFINDMLIEDSEGNEIFVSDLSDEEKIRFYEIWKEKNIEELMQKFSTDEELMLAVDIENKAFDKAYKSCKSVIGDFTIDSFAKKYEKELRLLMKKSLVSRSVDSSKENPNEITSDCLIPNSVSILEKEYKMGRILVCTDTSSSSASSYIGHCSMMCYSEWDKEWGDDGLQKIAITSYPAGKNAYWEGKSDGVQLEPMGLWAGNRDSSASKVSIYDVRKVRWVWDWFNSHYEYTEAPDDDYIKAVKYAEDQKGKPYNWFFLYKDNQESFYCSSLVYLAWLSLSEDYRMSYGLWISPSGIASSDKTVFVRSYNNK